ncbi:ABC transporter substrate-binding protein [Parablautia sp. Marseille-Q6255]|uniref:ABC transporter substrate-binding protein n=1 Tax=Parablautia sp. Marseille-Q6255 TaxID=3039593 RepID=UPI0024BBF97D|nr:extracellular solute-binding protein [Parablautia sp. Marseille-Q6255]
MKKKVLAAILAAAMAVTGLGTFPVMAQEEEQIELTFWHNVPNETGQKVIENAIARFNEEYPNVKVTVVANENDPYKTKIATAMAAGEEPDIMTSNGGGWLKTFVDEGKILDLTDRIAEVEDEYYPAALSLFEYDDKRYGLPTSFGPAPVYFNKQIYEELGLKIPTTLEEFEANLEACKEAGYIPFTLANSAQWPGALTFIWLSLRYGGKDAFLNAYNRENGGTFEDESFIKAGEKIQEWVEKGYYPEGFNAMNDDTGASRMLFYSGQAVHFISTNGMAANCTSEAPEFYENNLDMFVFPEIEGGKGNVKEILGGGNGWSITSKCEHPDEAFALIHYLSDKDYAQDNVDLAGVVSGAKGVEMPNPIAQKVSDILQEADYVQNFYDQFLPTDLAALHKQTTYDLFGLTTTPEQAAADMEALAKETLD